MRLDHRILMGITSAIGKMGPQSQTVTDRLAYNIGLEIGQELSDRGVLNKSMSSEQVWSVLNRELSIDESGELEIFGSGASSEVRIKVSACKFCPEKIGKSSMPAAACPVGGIFKGVSEALGLFSGKTKLELVTGTTCSIYLSEEPN